MCYTLLRHGFTTITRSLVTEWGVSKQLNTMMIVFTGVTRLKSCVSCVCTHCFQLFGICRVGFIWGYIDGLVQQRRNSGAFSNGEHYVFLALTHRNIHHGTRSRVCLSYTNYCWWPGAAGSQCFSRYLKYHLFSVSFFQPRYWQYYIVLNFSWFFVHVQCIFPNVTKKYDNEKLRIAQPRRPGFKQSNPVIETNIFRLNK